jgi:hypothetical protein
MYHQSSTSWCWEGKDRQRVVLVEDLLVDMYSGLVNEKRSYPHFLDDQKRVAL